VRKYPTSEGPCRRVENQDVITALAALHFVNDAFGVNRQPGNHSGFPIEGGSFNREMDAFKGKCRSCFNARTKQARVRKNMFKVLIDWRRHKRCRLRRKNIPNSVAFYLKLAEVTTSHDLDLTSDRNRPKD
jgi:hypothetical protein